MKKQNVVRLLGFFVFAVMVALLGLFVTKAQRFSQVLNSPPLGAELDGEKSKIYKIKVRKSDPKANKGILGFSAETAKALGIDGEADFEKDLDAVPSEKNGDDYTNLLNENKTKKPRIVESEHDYETIRKELDRIRAAEEKVTKAEEAKARKQSQKDSQAHLRDIEREKKLKKKYKKQIENEINQKYYIQDVDYEYNGLTE